MGKRLAQTSRQAEGLLQLACVLLCFFLTWLILQVEDGHDVIGEIKDRKHSHFGEDLGEFAQIQDRQYIHVFCRLTGGFFSTDKVRV